MAANFDALSPALAPRSDVRDLPPGVLVATMPQAILDAGERAAFHSVEFFTARLSNPHTRAAYGRAMTAFCEWCHARGVPLPALSSPLVAAYYHEQLLKPAHERLLEYVLAKPVVGADETWWRLMGAKAKRDGGDGAKWWVWCVGADDVPSATASRIRDRQRLHAQGGPEINRGAAER